MNFKRTFFIIIPSIILFTVLFTIFINSKTTAKLYDRDSFRKVETIPIQGEFIIKYKVAPKNIDTQIKQLTGLDDFEIKSKIKSNIITIKSNSLKNELNASDLTSIKATNESLIKKIKSDKNVEVVEQNMLLINAQTYIPNDSLYSKQWSHKKTNIENGWNIEKGSNDTIIAIIDSGVDFKHPDLSPNMIADCKGGCPTGMGYDMVDLDTYYLTNAGYQLYDGVDYESRDNLPNSNDDSHGTHVAGIVAAKGNNSIGVSGSCPECKLMSIRIFAGIKNSNGVHTSTTDWDDYLAAIYYATDNGADVINLSLGTPSGFNLHKMAIDYAYTKGVVIVAGAGNNNSNELFYPAAYDNVIAVGALAENNTRAYYSNYGSFVDIAAPGGDFYSDSMILSTVPTTGPVSNPSGYDYYQGTSMATPYIAGVAGLIRSYNPNLTNKDAMELIIQNGNIITTDKPIGKKVNVNRSLKVIPTKGKLFSDVPWNHIFAEHIYKLRDDYIVNGYSATLFEPDKNVTRGQMAKFIQRGFNLPIDLSCGNFSDISDTHIFYKEITTLKCKGIISGFPDGTYRPDDSVSRSAAMKFIINGARIKERGFLDKTFLPNTSTKDFLDMPKTHIFYESVMSGYSNEIVNGFPGNIFKPDDPVSRGAMSKMINNTRNKITNL